MLLTLIQAVLQVNYLTISSKETLDDKNILLCFYLVSVVVSGSYLVLHFGPVLLV